MSTSNTSSNTTTPRTPNFSSGTSADADLAARLAAPVSPTEAGTQHAAAEAHRRTSEWKPPVQRTPSFDHEEYKRAMMAASGTLSGAGPAAGPQGSVQ